MTDDVTIVVGSTTWGGWEGVSITRGIETVPASFSLIGTERYPGSGNQVDILPGSPATVKIGSDTIITGYAERVWRRLSPGEHSLTLSGRSKLADLVDCSGFTQQWQFNNMTLFSMAQLVCKPFGITVTAPDGDSAPIPSWMLILTETGYEFLEEIARWSQKLLYDDTGGNLVIAALGDNAHSSGIVEGQNAQEFESLADVSQVYSSISAIYQDTSILQDGAGTTDISYLKDKQGNLVQATDTHLPKRADGQARYRPLLIISEQGNGMNDVVPKRVAWEMARRWGRSQAVTVTVDNWRDSDGNLWTPNWLVDVDLPSVKMAKKTLLITNVTYVRDGEDGTRAILTLMPPEAMAPMPSAPFLYSAAWDAASDGNTTGAQLDATTNPSGPHSGA